MPSFHRLRVRALRREAEDAIRLVIDVPAELKSVFCGKPGQHVVLRTWADGQELRRTYSLTGAAGELPLTLGIRLQPGGRCASHLSQSLNPGDVIELMPPAGHFGRALERAVPGSAAPRYVAFAAGSGLTPILSIVRTVLATQPQAQVALFYANRHSARAMFVEDLLALKDRHMARFALHFIMSAEPQEIELFNGRLDAQKVRELASCWLDVRSASEYFVCGPGSMVQEVSAALCALGVDATRIHSERFAPALRAGAELIAPARAPASAPALAVEAGAAESSASAEVTQVRIIKDGRERRFNLKVARDTVLEAAERAGLALPYSCRSGVCSTCRVRLLRGRVHMAHATALAPWEIERGFILACQARPLTSELVLDYDQI